MQYSDYIAELGSTQRYNDLISESDRYRAIRNSLSAAATPTRTYRLMERFGARLIAIGRRLCERRGELAVDVAFHPVHASHASGPHDRHVA